MPMAIVTRLKRLVSGLRDGIHVFLRLEAIISGTIEVLRHGPDQPHHRAHGRPDRHDAACRRGAAYAHERRSRRRGGKTHRRRAAEHRSARQRRRRYRNEFERQRVTAPLSSAIAALTNFTPSSLAHSAGPAMLPISQPERSIRSVVGMPNALPAVLRSSNTWAL